MSLENDWRIIQDLSANSMGGENGGFIEFGNFRLDLTERELLRDGVPIPLTIKAFELLTYLVQNAGHTVTKEELVNAVWPDAFVEEANVTRIVHTLRKTLGEGEPQREFIRTVPKRGYRFVEEVNASGATNDEIWPNTIEEPSTEVPTIERGYKSYLFLGISAALLLTVVAVLLFTLRTTNSSPPQVKPKSIAVLPFRVITSDGRDDDRDLAFAKDTITGLLQSKDLRVLSVSAIRGYRDETQDPLVIGRERGVDYVLESTYLVVNGQLDVTSNLFDVQNGSVIATVEYQGEYKDLITASRNIAAKVVPGLLAKLHLETLVPIYHSTENEEALRSYLQGIMLSNKRTVEDAEKALAEFEKAVRLDPNYAEGYMGLAFALSTKFVNGGERDPICERWTEAANKALELDPSSGDALTMVATNKRDCSFDIEGSNRDFERALALSPNSVIVRQFTAVHIMNEGRFDEALEHLRIAREIEEKSIFTQKLLGRVYFFARRYDAAIGQSSNAKDLDPEVEQTSFVFQSYELKGDLEQAMEWFLVVRSLDGEKDEELNEWRATYAASGWQGVLRRRLERALELERTTESVNKRARSLEEITTLSIQLGDYDRAFEYMNKAVDQYALFANQLLVNPYLDPIRSDPRYQAILARTWNLHGGNYIVF